MKKLMIAAATAAMIGGAFADACVYDATISIKSTNCKDGKVSAALAKYTGLAKGAKFAYRAKASLKYAGVFFGCECDTIAAPAWGWSNDQTSRKVATVQGYAFWDTALDANKKLQPFEIPFVNFDWVLLNRIGSDYTTLEGTWILRDNAAGEAFWFMGAGFGTATADDTCANALVKSMSGNFAGWRLPDNKAGIAGCRYCDPTLWGCTCWTFCACAPVDTRVITTAYGTWTIKYNKSESAALSNQISITDIKPFTTAKYSEVKKYIAAAEAATLAVLVSRDAKDYTVKPAELKDAFYKELKEDAPAAVTGLPTIAQALADFS